MMRVLNIVSICLSLVLAVVLYNVKYDAQIHMKKIRSLKIEARLEREAIHILRAEWSHLNQPGRLQGLAERYTKLKPLNARQIVTVNNLPSGRTRQREYHVDKKLGGYAENTTGSITVR